MQFLNLSSFHFLQSISVVFNTNISAVLITMCVLYISNLPLDDTYQTLKHYDVSQTVLSRYLNLVSEQQGEDVHHVDQGSPTTFVQGPKCIQ